MTEERLSMRVTESEKEKITKKADNLGLSITAYIKLVALNSVITVECPIEKQ